MSKQYTLAELAELLDTQLNGPKELVIKKLATLRNATPESLSFLSNPSYQKYLDTTKAGAVILSPEAAANYSGHSLVHPQPYLIFAKATHLFDFSDTDSKGIHPTASVAEDAEVHPTATIGPNVVIESKVQIHEQVHIQAGVVIGNNSTIGAQSIIKKNASLCHHTQVGEHCILHENVVIGSDGFGFAHDGKHWHKIAQLGRVLIGDHVEVGAGTTIDRGALEDTIISDHVILDNQIQIAHNVQIGKRTAIAANTGVAGSTIIGKDCVIGGGTGIGGHLNICDNVKISGMAIISKSIKTPNTTWSPGGIRSMSILEWRKNSSRFGQLNKLFKTVNALKKEINVLKEND